MKQRTILSVLFLFSIFTAEAKPVSEATARIVAYHFLARQIEVAPAQLKMVYSQQLPSQGHAAFYTFAVPTGGFVIVAGDDVAQPILANSDHNPFSSEVPENVAAYLSELTREIDYALAHDIQQGTTTAAQWDSLIMNIAPAPRDYSSSVSPLLTTTWDQGSPYNAQCPTSSSAQAPGGHVWAGCVATAMAQVIRYWGAPTSPRGWHKYTTSYGTHTVNFESQTYNYGNMPNSLTSSSSSAKKREVAKLLYHCGVAVDMNWSPTGSGAYMTSARVALINYFGYNSNTGIATRASYSNSDWISLLKTELNNGRPILYDGYPSGTGAGHAFVCDGYNSSNRFHFNFGWGGVADGYFALTAITPTAYAITYDFSYNQSAIIGAKPAWSHKRRFAQQAGNSIHYISDTLEVYNTLGHNSYQYDYGVRPKHFMIILPTDTTKQLLIEPISSTYRGVTVWDGSPRVSVLFRNNSYPYSTTPQQAVTSHKAVVIEEDSNGLGDFAFRIIVDNGCRLVTNLTATASGTQVALSWQENGTATRWQVEYGPAGFSHGSGTVISRSSTSASLSIPYDEAYDFYVRSSCGGGSYGRWSNRARVTLPTPQYTVVASSDNPLMGTVSGSGTYALGATATLQAQARAGYRFLHWNDGITANPRSVTVNSNLQYTAYFEQITYRITATPNDAALGTVGGGGTYAEGQSATLQATPATDCRFVRWNDGAVDNPRQIQVSSDSTFVAYFEAIPTYIIAGRANDSTMGTVSGGGYYLEGSSVTLTATPSPNHRFLRWEDGSTDNPRIVSVSSNSTFIAIFEVIPTYFIAGHTNDSAMGTVSGGGYYLEGSSVTLTATPSLNHRFLQWNDGEVCNPRIVNVTSSITLTAYFAPNTYTLHVRENDSNMGTVTGGGTFAVGSTATLHAYPSDGYRFRQWHDGNTDNPRLVQVTSDSTFIALFEPLPIYTVTVESNSPTMGTVSGGGNYVEGTEICLEATAATGHRFLRWSDGNTSNPRTLTVNVNISFTAMFAPREYLVTTTSNDAVMGTALGGGQYPYGTSISIAAIPNENYRFRRWNDGVGANPRTLIVTADSCITAHFEPIEYTLIVNVNDTSMGTALGGGTFHTGTTVSIVAVARGGYQFNHWQDGNTDNPRSIAVVADATYVAYFGPEVGVGDVESAPVSVWVSEGTIHIDRAIADAEVRIYDLVGRRIATVGGEREVHVSRGVYIVKIDALPAIKVVVTR